MMSLAPCFLSTVINVALLLILLHVTNAQRSDKVSFSLFAALVRFTLRKV